MVGRLIRQGAPTLGDCVRRRPCPLTSLLNFERETNVISFTSEDETWISQPYDDALVVTMTIGNYNTHHILIDSGSFADIVFMTVFEKMKLV